MEGLVITTRGQSLVTRLIAEEATARFTKLSLSNQTYEADALEGLTELSDVRQTVDLTSVTKIDDNTVEILAQVDNSTLTLAYNINALGIYAEDETGAEILFGVARENATATYMPAYSGRTLTQITYRINVKVDNADQVTLYISPGAYATVEQITQYIENLEDRQDGFYESKTTVFTGTDRITETFGDRRVETSFVNDNLINQQLYVNGSLTASKSITFSADGNTITEEVN